MASTDVLPAPDETTTPDSECDPGAPRAVLFGVRRLLLNKGLLSIIDQALVSGTNFVTSVLIGRLCSQEDLGVYYLALSLVFFVRGIQEQVVSVPYMIYAPRRSGAGLASFTGSMFAHQAGLTVLTCVGLLGLLAGLSCGWGPTGLGPTAVVLLGAAPFLLLRDCIRHYAFAHFQLLSAIAIDTAVCVLQLGGLLLLSSMNLLSVTTVYCVMGAACAVSCVGWFRLCREPMQFTGKQVVADWRHNWPFARWALASQLVGCTTPFLMPWLLALVQGEAATGILAACSTLVGLPNMFITGLSKVISPKAARAYTSGGVEELSRVLWKAAGLFLAMVGAFFVILAVAGDQLLVLVYGSQYASAGPIIAALAFGMLMNSLGIVAGNGLWALYRPSANFAADAVSLVTTLIAIVVLVPPLAVLGMALASMIGLTAGTAVRALTLWRLMSAARAAQALAQGGR